MKKQLLLVLVILFTVNSVSLMAKIRPVSEVKNIAEKHFSTTSITSRASSPAITQIIPASEILSGQKTRSGNNGEPFYVMVSSGGRSVIISGDDSMKPILGYTNKRFDKNNVNDGLKALLSIYGLLYNDIQLKGAAKPQVYSSATFPSAVPSLLDGIAWDQVVPYNNLCPILSNGKKGFTGCIATAMAMVMRYHQYPAIGTGSANGIDFAARPFVWNKMLKTYGWGSDPADCNDAVAWLMRCCGASVDMQYGLSSSGAGDSKIPKALSENFLYDKGVTILSRSTKTSQQWLDALKTEFSSGRPVIYSGFTVSGTEGHCFVLDGYDSNGLFSVNWGYNGGDNGYYEITSLKDYNVGETAVIGIQKPVTDGAYVSRFSRSSSSMEISSKTIARNGQFSVLEKWGYINRSDTFTGFFALVLFKNGMHVTTLGIPKKFTNIVRNDGITIGFKDVSIPSYVVAGRYQLYVATKDDREASWQPVEMDIEMLPYFDVDISTDQIIFSNPVDRSKAVVASITPSLSDKIYFNETTNFKIKVENSGTEWNGFFNIRISSLSGGGISEIFTPWRYPIIRGTTELNVSRLMKYPPGDYKIEFLYSHDAINYSVMEGSENHRITLLPENYEDKYEYHVVAKSAQMEKNTITNKEGKPRLLIELSCVGSKAITKGSFTLSTKGNGINKIDIIPISMAKGETRKFALESTAIIPDGDGYSFDISIMYPNGFNAPIKTIDSKNLSSFSFGVRTLQSGK